MTPVVVAGVESQDIGAEVMVLADEMLQRLAGSAAEIWRRIDGVRSTAQIVADLQEVFGSDPQLVQDVPTFLAELEGAGLIRLEAAAPGRFSVPATVAWDNDGNRVVLADLQTGTRTALSDTATLMWELAGEGRTAEEVVAELALAFPDAPSGLPGDVVAGLDELVSRGWLTAG